MAGPAHIASPDDVVAMTVFARVVEAKSFTGAAERLGLSKSVVSWRIAKLEERLGVRLLHRTTRKLSLTVEGLRFYERCARIVEEADEVAELAAGVGDQPRGLLRVAVPVTLGQLYLGPPVAEFLAKYPEVRLDLRLADRMTDLVAESVDLVIRAAIVLPDSNLVARKLCTDRRLIWAAPAYLARKGTPKSTAELVHHNCLNFSVIRRGLEWRFRGPRGPISIPTTGNLITDSATMLSAAAVAGVGLAVLPYFIVAPEVAAGRLVPVLERDSSFDLGIYALHPPARRLPASLRRFIDHLVTYFRQPPWLRDRLDRPRRRG